LFLDEIRQLDHLAQSKLLGLLDRKSFRRTGAVNDVEVDVRYVCATNQILFDQVKKGLFRDDLYYRLQVVSINLPPLRERGDDCLILAEYFVRRLNQRYGRTIRGWDTKVADVFRAYHWPGNVRELENLLERIFVLESQDVIKVEHIPPRIMREVSGDRPSERQGPEMPDWEGKSFQDATDAFQIRLIRQALDAAGGRKGDAAATLGLSRHALRHQMNRLGVR
jgi:two-component system response regulator AtoC